MKLILDILFPKKCVGCGRLGKYVCSECEVGLWEEEQICPACRRASRYGLKHKYCHEPYSLDGLTCLWAYEGLARKIIKKAKYKGYFDMLKFLISDGGFLDKPEYAYFQKFLEMKPTVVPVPLHKKRLRERGFNQSLIITKTICQIWHLPLNDCLIRVKDTGHQVGRTRQERLDALKSAFSLSIKHCALSTVLLVDDVWTTGATMNECCRVLKKSLPAGRQVWGLVLAR